MRRALSLLERPLWRVCGSLGGLRVRRTAFICGCGHSGTTLVATILSTHPEVYIPLRETELFFEGQDSLAKLDRLRFEALWHGKRFLTEKTPRHIRSLDQARQKAPRAKFILLVRDGRDVTASIGHREGGNFAAGFDRWVADTSIVDAERQSGDVFVLRYEDLVAAPAARIAAMCQFLDLPYFDGLLDYHAKPNLWYGRTRIRRTNGVATEHEDLRNWQVNQPIFDGRGRWRNELPPHVIAQFADGKARQLMDAFGYAIE